MLRLRQHLCWPAKLPTVTDSRGCRFWSWLSAVLLLRTSQSRSAWTQPFSTSVWREVHNAAAWSGSPRHLRPRSSLPRSGPLPPPSFGLGAVPWPFSPRTFRPAAAVVDSPPVWAVVALWWDADSPGKVDAGRRSWCRWSVCGCCWKLQVVALLRSF